MPDSELFKLILQMGSFGLLAIGIVWLLFRGAPMLKDTLEKTTADNTKALTNLTDTFRAEMREWRAWFGVEMEKRDRWFSAEMALRDSMISRLGDTINKLGESIEDMSQRITGCPHNKSDEPPPRPGGQRRPL